MRVRTSSGMLRKADMIGDSVIIQGRRDSLKQNISFGATSS